ncbi:MAG: hypothetical protein ACRC2T_11755 [Thermoguttaceae bacterium]
MTKKNKITRVKNKEQINHEALLGELKLQVVCTDQNGSTIVIGPNEQHHTIRDVSRLTNCRLNQILGPYSIKVYESKPHPEGLFSMEEVKNAISIKSYSALREETLNKMGQGIIRIKNQIVLVNGPESFLCNPTENTLTPIDKPIIDNTLINKGSTKWINNAPELYASLDNSKARQIMTGLVMYVRGNRNWGHPQDPELIAALILATYIQGGLNWRPMVGIVGATESGKTYLLRRIKKLLGQLAEILETPTEAGLRQKMTTNLLPLIVDEFDSCLNAEGILKLCRSAGHAGTVVKGTQNHKPQEFHVRHLLWLGGIHLSMKYAQDYNRFIRINLPSLTVAEADQEPDFEDHLINYLPLLAIKILDKANQLYTDLCQRHTSHSSSRMIANFAIPAAVYAVAMNMQTATCEDAQAVLNNFLENRTMPEAISTKTHDDLLEDILLSKVEVNTSLYNDTVKKKFINECLNTIIAGNALPSVQAGTKVNRDRRIITPEEEALSEIGIRIVHSNDECYLFLVPKILLKEILQNSKWKKVELDTILKNIPGAYSSQQRLPGTRTYGIMVPMDYIRERLIDDSSCCDEDDNQTSDCDAN